ncbi:polysaccharide biosynthesis tyrosine autokinase [Prosthecobacter sp.]|uniref:polysaccharide biosynthesis tyrosine autokinase n=1 Tax=Prosthecobacter sp. TaxID=1965333 RepID=UPI0037833728
MATTKKFLFTFQDIVQYASRYVKYWKVATLLFLLGLVVSLVYYTYGQPTFYSRSLVTFTNLTLPVKSETSDAQGRGRYAQIEFQIITALNSRWLLERTAERLGIVKTAGQYEYIREQFVSKVEVTLLPGDMVQIEIYAYQPRWVREWPEAMLEAYRESTVQARASHREAAFKAYSAEMVKIKERINASTVARSKFEEDHQLIEQYVEHNSLEAVPSEMLTARTRLDNMAQVLKLLENPSMSIMDRLAVIKRFRGTPVPVGSIVRSSPFGDSLIAKSSPDSVSPAAGMTSNVQQPSVGSGNDRKSQIIVLPSMVEETEPWEESERELRHALLEKDQLSKTLLPGHEKMRALDLRIQKLEDSIAGELKTAVNSFHLEYQQLKDRYSELITKMPDYRRVLTDFDRYKQDFSLMSETPNFWEAAYKDLQQRLSTMEHTGVDMRVEFDFQGFTLMRDDVPFSPNKYKLLTYALLLGVGSAGAGCIGLERLRSTTSLVVETETLTGRSALGVIPLIKDSEYLNPCNTAEKAPDSSINLSETFRIVRCSIPLHVSRDNPCKVIMITSSRPGEGKTSVSTLLAKSIAESGQKTLLIDGDLRRGRIHRMFDLPADKKNLGLAGFLVSDDLGTDDIIIKSVLPDLDLMVRGSGTDSRLDLLSSTKLESLFNQLRDKYDKIIVDTPPILGLADSIMLAAHADGVVFVLRADSTSQRDILTALDVLNSAHATIYGFILNGVDLSKVENYYYYASYYPKYYDPAYLAQSSAN